MSRIAYVNGQYLPFSQACVHVEDRGYQFADGVYEVIAISRGRLIDEPRHLERLDRSLSALSIDAPMSQPALRHVMRETIRRNRVADGILYLQITRGVAKRDHPFPPGIPPALVITVRRQKPVNPRHLADGVGVITIADIRWKRCDIKSISLLPNILGKQQARQAGAFEAWMVDERGFVSEGTSTNAWIVTGGGEIVTRPAGAAILNGVTRLAVLEVAREAGLTVVERPFSVAEAMAATEAFLTSSTSYVLPIVSIDGKPVGNGHPGVVAQDLRKLYQARASI